jgi:murein DD-endopeptidase MepM/ murein hydrolase activator NlpD
MSSRLLASHYRHGDGVAHRGNAKSDGSERQGSDERRAGHAYTLVHGGRAVRVRPAAFWLLVALLAGMAAWTITTASYFAFREDVLTGLIARQTDMQFGYEDRIAELRAQVDRMSSRQLLDQEQYEQKLEQILRRQTALESRANALSGLGDVTGSIRQGGRGAAEPRAVRPSQSNDKGAFHLPLGTQAELRSYALAPGGMSAAIARLHASLDHVEQRQTATLNMIEENYEAKARRMRTILSEIGAGGLRIAAAEHATGMGGPFVPARLPKESIAFERQLQRISIARSHLHRLSRALMTVPLRKPIDGEIDLVSSFGVRLDPFSGSPAMHTGLDIHGEIGESVRATADGTVSAAGWSGGYGRSVDIDHGNGLSSRYAHLSSIDVRVGQSVKSGQIIGRLGTSGRSTGPHLHYETRIRGEAVDPQRFLRAAQRLDSAL